MDKLHSHEEVFCSCCRREFLGAASLAVGSMALNFSRSAWAGAGEAPQKGTAAVMGAFLYPPSDTLRVKGGWWSWPGNDFDAEGRQKKYMSRIQEIEKKLGMRIEMEEKPIASQEDADRFIGKAKKSQPDAILLIPFMNTSFAHIDRILKEVAPKASNEGAVAEPGIPAVIFSCLGVKHGPITQYQKPGVHIIQSLDNLDAVEYAMKMINARRKMKESRIISVAGKEEGKEAVVPFWGTTVRTVSLARFEEEVNKTEIDGAVKKLAAAFKRNAKKILEPAEPEILQAARVHFANKRILETEGGDAMMMDCLRRGELMPCMSFMTLRDEGIAAGCENDLGPTLTLMLIQHLFDRSGFQHNPSFETESNHYFASHCTSASKLFGADKPQQPYLLRNYGHTNDPTCAPQVLWREGEAVTMAHIIPAEKPQMLIYSGKVVKSYDMPPVGGCRTNVEITINELDDACQVKGHHNVLFYGDYAKRMRQFAQLYGIAAMA
ncbi:MAG: hypothetical protein AB1656_22395 [Candidatus Omnitrophota bacterium]